MTSLASTAICLLSGCATPIPFDESNSENAAKLRVINASVDSYYLFLASADPIACTAGGPVGHLSGDSPVEPKRFEMLGQMPPRAGIVERRLPPGKAISFVPQATPKLDAFTILTSMGVSRDSIASAQSAACETPVFVPMAGEEYELTYQPAPGRCSVTLKRLSRHPDGSVSREDMSDSSKSFVSPVLGTYLRGIPKVACRTAG